MIAVNDESEFTLIFADFIETLSKTEKFTVKIWTNGSELPHEYDDSFCFYFLSEGVRVMNGEYMDYIFFDTITGMRVIYG